MTDDVDTVMGDIAEKAADNGGPGIDDVLRAVRASHKTLGRRLGTIEKHLADHSDATQELVAETVTACRTACREETADAVALAKEHAGRKLDRRAVNNWISDRVKRGVIIMVFLVAVVSAILLIADHRDDAADIAIVVAIVSPFVLLLYRRG